MRALPADFVVRFGHHETCDEGGCVNDWVSYCCGTGQITDHPPCESPACAEFAIVLNDSMPSDEMRTRLLGPLISILATTVITPKLEQQRAYYFADRAVRLFAPLALDAWGLPEQASTLRALPEAVDAASDDRAAARADRAAASADRAAAIAAIAAIAARAARAAAIADSGGEIWQQVVDVLRTAAMMGKEAA